jgi:hypothetical protein
MLKCALLILVFAGNAEKKQNDTIIKWSENYKLGYADFAREHFGTKDSLAKYDTLATIDCFIKYEIKLESGKRVIHAFAAMHPQTSWMKVKLPGVLQHEQGHFDLTEIYARKFEKTVNDTSISNPHDYFLFFTEYFKQTMEDLNAENEKYDIWTLNAFGKEYYYRWITQQLSQLK